MNTPKTSEPPRRFTRFAPFVLTALCFLLPFLQISCPGQRPVSLTGIQLATGSTIDQPDAFTGQIKRREVKNEICVSVSLLCVVIAALASFISGKTGPFLSAIFGVFALISLFLAMNRLDDAAVREGQGLLTIQYQPGFLLTFVFGALSSMIAASHYRKAGSTRAPPPEA